MKKVFSFLLFVLIMNTLSAQTLSDEQRLSILPYLPDRAEIPQAASNLLLSKMQQIISNNGISDRGLYQRFVLTTKINVTSKDIVSGLPPMVSQKYDITFMIGDVVEDKVYSSVTIPIVGIGETETKALLMAIKTIAPDNVKFSQLTCSAKELITAYYRTNCNRIISEAYAKVEMNRHDEALYILAAVPDVCSDCFLHCQAAMVDIYRRLLNDNGRRLLNKAKEEWGKCPNYKGAEIAVQYVEQIDINAECQPEVQLLLETMEEKIKADEKRAWEFKIQKYRDEQARKKQEWEFKVRQYEDAQAKEQRDFEFSKQKYEDSVEMANKELDFERHKFDTNTAIEKQAVSAARDVALEYAKNQPETVNYNNTIYW